jgi:hypothetical protein
MTIVSSRRDRGRLLSKAAQYCAGGRMIGTCEDAAAVGAERHERPERWKSQVWEMARDRSLQQLSLDNLLYDLHVGIRFRLAFH